MNVHDVLDQQNETTADNVATIIHAPSYSLDWSFIDKNTIRVTFKLFRIPNSLMHKTRHLHSDDDSSNIVASMVTKPSQTLNSISSLNYSLFSIRSHLIEKEVFLPLAKPHRMEDPTSNTTYLSNSLRLSALNHHEKYTICIFYFQENISLADPELVLCQDIINDYSKFSNLKADLKHGLLFITTQYSIIIVLLVILQTSYTSRKRHWTRTVRQQLTTTANTIRTTLSSVSIGRQSFSSFDHGEHHATNGHATTREPTIDEEDLVVSQEVSIKSPSIIISETNSSNQRGAGSICEENQPFLRKVPSKNHVHFLLGPGEGSDDEMDQDMSFDQNRRDSQSGSTRRTSFQAEPYGDQTDALLSMAHILDTNKPWSRHNNDPSIV